MIRLRRPSEEEIDARLGRSDLPFSYPEVAATSDPCLRVRHPSGACRMWRGALHGLLRSRHGGGHLRNPGFRTPRRSPFQARASLGASPSETLRRVLCRGPRASLSLDEPLKLPAPETFPLAVGPRRRATTAPSESAKALIGSSNEPASHPREASTHGIAEPSRRPLEALQVTRGRLEACQGLQWASRVRRGVAGRPPDVA
jgi:hypothetical protein